jgi:hypothetical protein
MGRRLVVVSAIAVVLAAAFLPGSGFGSPAAVVRTTQKIPSGLAAAIRARLGAGAIRSASATTADPNLGNAVALSGDGTTALVGAPGVGGGNGAAYIFHASDAGSWSSSGKPLVTLTKHGSTPGLFGIVTALSADGTTAVVGAPLAGSALFTPGAIYVFHASSEDAWSSSSTPKAALTVSHSFLLGISLALSPDGTTLVAGAEDTDAGGAYVFHVASEGAWASTSTPTATLKNAAQSTSDKGAGLAVAISGDGATALVSDDGNPNGGGAYVYHASTENAWTSSSAPTATLRQTGAVKADHLGSAVALSGDGAVALLGARGVNSSTGKVDVFHSSGAWASTSTPTATLTVAGGATGDSFGENLALSSDGTTALILAPDIHSGTGATYIFRSLGEGAWTSSCAHRDPDELQRPPR